MNTEKDQPSESGLDCESFEAEPGGLERERIISILAQAIQISRSADLSTAIHEMLDLMIGVSQAVSAHYFQLEPSTDELVITHIRGEVKDQYLIGLRVKGQQGLASLFPKGMKATVLGDTQSESVWLHAMDPVNSSGKRNAINLPVCIRDVILGVVQIFNFQKPELDLLTLLGERLAIEIDHHRTVSSVRKANQRLLSLVEMLGEVAGTLDRSRLLHLVTEDAARLVDAERSSLFLIDPNTRDMIFQVAYQPPEGNGQMQAPPHEEFPPKKQTGSLSLSSKKAAETSLEDSAFSYFNRSSITVPLKSDPLPQDRQSKREHILGGLMVLNRLNSSFQEEDARLMQILANQASTFLQVAEMYESSGELFLGVIKALIAAIDAKDPYTQGHSQRVSDYSVLIARELGFEETSINDIRIGSLLHDIGKIGIPDSILKKGSTLTVEEMELVREHPKTGTNILSQVTLLEPMLPAILEHHERLDGSGYPSHLNEKQISWMGKIVAVADVFDAMTSNRPYRHSASIQEVQLYLNENAGILFDSAIVKTLDSILTRSM